MLEVAGLGGAGPVGGLPGFTGGSASASAGPSRSGDIAPSLGLQTGSGSRGFVNSPVFPGARATTDNSVNTGGIGSLSGTGKYWLIGGAVLVVAIFLFKRYGSR